MATSGAPLEQMTCSVCLSSTSAVTLHSCGHSLCPGCTHDDRGQCPACPDSCVALLTSRLRLQDQPRPVGSAESQMRQFLMSDIGAVAVPVRPRPRQTGTPAPMAPPAPRQNKVVCSRHPQTEMSLFCVEDNALLCGECAAHHKAHRIVPAVEQIPQMKIILRNEKIKTANVSRNVKMDVLKAQMNTDAFKESAKLQKEELEVDFSKLTSAIADVTRRLMASVEEKEKRLLQKAQSEVAKMEATCQSLEDTVSNMDAVLKSTDPSTLMQAYNSLQRSQSRASTIQSTGGVTFDPEEKLTDSRDIREQLLTAVTSIWKDQGPIAVEPLDIDFTSDSVYLHKLEKYGESLTFDVTTAGKFMWVSPDGTLARNSGDEFQQPHASGSTNYGRLNDDQVRAKQTFTGGKHFWKVAFSTYPVYLGIKGDKTSWCVEIFKQNRQTVAGGVGECGKRVWSGQQATERAGSGQRCTEEVFPWKRGSRFLKFGVYLDYDSGILCLYGLPEDVDPELMGMFDEDENPLLLHSLATCFNKQVLSPVFQLERDQHVNFMRHN